jgi:hypothetical protein
MMHLRIIETKKRLINEKKLKAGKRWLEKKNVFSTPNT